MQPKKQCWDERDVDVCVSQYKHTVRRLNIHTITFLTRNWKQDTEHQHAKQWCLCVDESKAITNVASDRASDIVWRLYSAPYTGKHLSV